MAEDSMHPLTRTNITDAEIFPRQFPAISTADMATILIHNDEVTPYEYVIDILSDLFMLTEELADHIAWTAHTKGTAAVVVRPRGEAEKLVKVAHGRARLVRYPLTFSLEQD